MHIIWMRMQLYSQCRHVCQMMHLLYGVKLNKRLRKVKNSNQSVWWSKRVGSDGLDMLNEKMIMTGLNVVWCGRLEELDRKYAWKRPGGILLRMTWKVQACPKRMHSLGLNGEWELRRQPANPGSPGKWPLKRSVCVCLLVWYGMVY